MRWCVSTFTVSFFKKNPVAYKNNMNGSFDIANDLKVFLAASH